MVTNNLANIQMINVSAGLEQGLDTFSSLSRALEGSVYTSK